MRVILIQFELMISKSFSVPCAHLMDLSFSVSFVYFFILGGKYFVLDPTSLIYEGNFKSSRSF